MDNEGWCSADMEALIGREMLSSDKIIDPAELSGLNLAYLGDAVFELCTRSKIMSLHNTTVNRLSRLSMAYVSARAQSEMYQRILETASPEEANILRRGRNAKSYTKAKNATVSQYRHATGVEALFGYLYLKGDMNRIQELFELCTTNME